MTVKKWPEFKKLPLDRNSRVERKIIIKGEESWWKELEWDNQVSQNFSCLFQSHLNLLSSSLVL